MIDGIVFLAILFIGGYSLSSGAKGKGWQFVRLLVSGVMIYAIIYSWTHPHTMTDDEAAGYFLDREDYSPE